MNTKPSKWLEYCLNNFVKNKKTALDLACGKGRNSLLLASYGFSVTSVDINSEYLQFFSSNKIKKIEK